MRKRKFLVYGADVDDFPRPVCLPEVTHDRLGYEKHAFQVDVQNGVEIRFRHVPEVGAFLKAGVVDEDIDLAEARDGLCDESLAVGNITDVRLKGRGAALCRRCYSLHYFIRPLLVFAIADRDTRAFAGQTLRDRASDPLIAAGYGSYFALQSIGQDPS